MVMSTLAVKPRGCGRPRAADPDAVSAPLTSTQSCSHFYEQAQINRWGCRYLRSVSTGTQRPGINKVDGCRTRPRADASRPRAVGRAPVRGPRPLPQAGSVREVAGAPMRSLASRDAAPFVSGRSACRSARCTASLGRNCGDTRPRVRDAIPVRIRRRPWSHRMAAPAVRPSG